MNPAPQLHQPLPSQGCKWRQPRSARIARFQQQQAREWKERMGPRLVQVLPHLPPARAQVGGQQQLCQRHSLCLVSVPGMGWGCEGVAPIEQVASKPGCCLWYQLSCWWLSHSR